MAAATRVWASPIPTANPRRDNTANPIVARATANHATPEMRSLRRTAANTGVSTTYVPVMKPEIEASVCCSPIVWSTCAPP
jgi:hypothetical protein